jgi:hypothetical protein
MVPDKEPHQSANSYGTFAASLSYGLPWELIYSNLELREDIDLVRECSN